jgi:hypothetical protein
MSKNTPEFVSTEIITSNLPKCGSAQCHNCFSSSSALKKCSTCKCVRYCSEKCQLNNWNEHKTLCKRLKDFSSIISESKEYLEKHSRKNYKIGFIEVKENLVRTNLPIIYTNMTLEEISFLVSKVEFSPEGISKLMSCVFQKSLTDRKLSIMMVMMIIYFESSEKNLPQFEWFIKNLKNCSVFFGKNSTHQQAYKAVAQALQFQKEDGILSEFLVDVWLKIFQNFENPKTYFDGFAGSELLLMVMGTPKEKKIIEYMKNVLKNYQEFENCLVIEVILFVGASENKELINLLEKNMKKQDFCSCLNLLKK